MPSPRTLKPAQNRSVVRKVGSGGDRRSVSSRRTLGATVTVKECGGVPSRTPRPPLWRGRPTGQARSTGGVAWPGADLLPSIAFVCHSHLIPDASRAPAGRAWPLRGAPAPHPRAAADSPPSPLVLAPLVPASRSVSRHRRGSRRGHGVAVAPPPPRLPLLAQRGLRAPRAARRGPPGSHASLRCAGGRVKTWKRRWFILTDNCLYYFEYTTVSSRGRAGRGDAVGLSSALRRRGGSRAHAKWQN